MGTYEVWEITLDDCTTYTTCVPKELTDQFLVDMMGSRVKIRYIRDVDSLLACCTLYDKDYEIPLDNKCLDDLLDEGKNESKSENDIC